MSDVVNPAEPIDYPYYYNAPSNTGIQSGFDLNRGIIAEIDDGFGSGVFRGQHGFIVLSKFKIDMVDARTIQEVYMCTCIWLTCAA
jgi:hypothetical protein